MGIAVVYNLFLTKGVSFIRSIRLESKIKQPYWLLLYGNRVVELPREIF